MGQSTSIPTLPLPQFPNHDFTAEISDDCLAINFQSLYAYDKNTCLLVCRRWLTIDGQTRYRLALNSSSSTPLHLPKIFIRFDSVNKLAIHSDRKSVVTNHDFTTEIPDDCLTIIFQSLYACNKNTYSLVCRRWLTVDSQTCYCLALNSSSSTLLHLPKIFNRFDSVTKLALRSDRKSLVTFTNDDLTFISTVCRNLTRLKLHGYRRRWTDNGNRFEPLIWDFLEGGVNWSFHIRVNPNHNKFPN